MQALLRPAIVLCTCLPVLMVSLQIWYMEANGRPYDYWGMPRGLGMTLIAVLPLVAAVGIGWSVRRFWKWMQPPQITPRGERAARQQRPPAGTGSAGRA